MDKSFEILRFGAAQAAESGDFRDGGIGDMTVLIMTLAR